MDLWDPSLPGAGAQRAALVLQLYMRMGHYTPLSILVADALCLTFKVEGATVMELSTYLGLTPDRVEAGIEGIPNEIYCTSLDIRQGEGDDNGKSEKSKNNGNSSSNKRGRQEGTEENGLRYYINYATLLPFAYAHGTHMLLALCQLPLPQQTSINGVHSGEISSLNVSPALKRADCRRGLCCASCRYWMALKDLRSTISRCPLCQADILEAVLRVIKSRLEDKLIKGQQLLIFGPLQQRSTISTNKPVETNSNSNNLKTVNDDTIDYPLSRDPFLVQQGLFFQFLFSHSFVRVNDSSFVIDIDEVMTKEEYDHRLKHRATVLDQFRLVHRNTGSIRVKCLDQDKIDAEKCMASAMKVAKRMQLPPWLRTNPLFAEDDENSSSKFKEELNANTILAELKTTKRSKHERDIASAAKYIAREFFDDDFDEVPLRKLPLS